MNTPGAAAIATIESGPAFAAATSLDFTRAQFTKNGRTHIELCCTHCGLRIMETASGNFDREEREHAATCEGSQAE